MERMEMAKRKIKLNRESQFGAKAKTESRFRAGRVKECHLVAVIRQRAEPVKDQSVKEYHLVVLLLDIQTILFPLHVQISRLGDM
jgi:hypothetical protein